MFCYYGSQFIQSALLKSKILRLAEIINLFVLISVQCTDRRIMTNICVCVCVTKIITLSVKLILNTLLDGT